MSAAERFKKLLPALGLLLLLTACSEPAAQSDNLNLTLGESTTAANYKTLILQPTDVQKESQLTVEPTYDTSVALQTDEELTFVEYLVSRDAQVEAGTPLVRLTRGAGEADVLEAQLALRRHEEETQATLADLLEKKTLASEAAADGTPLSQARAELAALEYEQAVTESRQKTAELTQALEEASAAREDVILTAPFDAVITSMTGLSTGAKLSEGTELMTLAKRDSLVLTGTSNTDFFQYGMSVRVEYGKVNSRKSVTGRVVATDRVLTDLPGQAAVYIVLDDDSLTADDLEKPTAYVTTQQLKNAMTVPKSAITTVNGKSCVNVLFGDTVQTRYVIKGITVGSVGDYQVQILAGLEYGWEIVLD